MMRYTPLLLVGGLLLAGCGSGSKTDSSDSSTSNNGGGTTPLKVVFIPKDSANPYFKPVIEGLEESSKALGFNFQTQGPAKADATSQLSIIKDQIQRKVDVIILSANSPDALNEALDDAKAKGIVVVTLDSDLTGNESHRAVAVMPTDPTKIGPAQIELLGKEMNYQGEFAILSATTDAPNQNAWIADMKTALKDPKYAKMKLDAIVYGNDEAQKSSTEMEGLMSKYPNLKGVLSPTSVGLAAAAQVLENSGDYPGGKNAVGGGIHLTGLSTPNQLKKFVTDGVIAEFQLWSPKDMGILAGYLGTAAKLKKIDLKFGGEVLGPKGEKLKLSDKGAVYAGNLVTFDKANIDKFNF